VLINIELIVQKYNTYGIHERPHYLPDTMEEGMVLVAIPVLLVFVAFLDLHSFPLFGI
jgi:hypothetical protein